MRPGATARLGMAAVAVAALGTGRRETAVAVVLALGASAAFRIIAPEPLDVVVAAVLLVHGVGSLLGLLEAAPWFDLAVQAVVAAALTCALGLIILAPDGGGTLLVAFLSAAAAAEWEGLQFLVDTAFGTSLAPSVRDTAWDLAASAAGICATLGLLRARVREAGGWAANPWGGHDPA